MTRTIDNMTVGDLKLVLDKYPDSTKVLGWDPFHDCEARMDTIEEQNDGSLLLQAHKYKVGA